MTELQMSKEHKSPMNFRRRVEIDELGLGSLSCIQNESQTYVSTMLIWPTMFYFLIIIVFVEWHIKISCYLVSNACM